MLQFLIGNLAIDSKEAQSIYDYYSKELETNIPTYIN